MNILPQYLTSSELETLETWAPTLNYKPVPEWLGNFSFRMFGTAYGKEHGTLPVAIEPIARRLMEIVPEQSWTTIFIQRYLVGEQVHTHRDPRNNHGQTCVAVFGSWRGAVSSVAASDPRYRKFRLERGDVLVLPTTIDGQQGPEHSVSPVKIGIRYAFVLNTIL
jgi:hypothetical protein